MLQLPFLDFHNPSRLSCSGLEAMGGPIASAFSLATSAYLMAVAVFVLFRQPVHTSRARAEQQNLGGLRWRRDLLEVKAPFVGRVADLDAELHVAR